MEWTKRSIRDSSFETLSRVLIALASNANILRSFSRKTTTLNEITEILSKRESICELMLTEASVDQKRQKNAGILGCYLCNI